MGMNCGNNMQGCNNAMNAISRLTANNTDITVTATGHQHGHQPRLPHEAIMDHYKRERSESPMSDTCDLLDDSPSKLFFEVVAMPYRQSRTTGSIGGRVLSDRYIGMKKIIMNKAIPIDIYIPLGTRGRLTCTTIYYQYIFKHFRRAAYSFLLHIPTYQF